MRAHICLSLFFLLWISLQITAFPIEKRKGKNDDNEVDHFASKLEEEEDIARALGVSIGEVPDDLSETERNRLAGEGAALDPSTPTEEFRGEEPKKKHPGSDGFLAGLWKKFKGASEALVQWEHENLKMPAPSSGNSGTAGLAAVLGELATVF